MSVKLESNGEQSTF